MTASWTAQPESSGGQRLVVTGQFDLADEEPSAADVEALLDADDEPVLLDLANLEFIDSSGVRALLRVRRSDADRVRLVAVSDTVRRVLLIAGIGDIVGVERAVGQ